MEEGRKLWGSFQGFKVAKNSVWTQNANEQICLKILIEMGYDWTSHKTTVNTGSLGYFENSTVSV